MICRNGGLKGGNICIHVPIKIKDIIINGGLTQDLACIGIETIEQVVFATSNDLVSGGMQMRSIHVTGQLELGNWFRWS